MSSILFCLFCLKLLVPCRYHCCYNSLYHMLILLALSMEEFIKTRFKLRVKSLIGCQFFGNGAFVMIILKVPVTSYYNYLLISLHCCSWFTVTLYYSFSLDIADIMHFPPFILYVMQWGAWLCSHFWELSGKVMETMQNQCLKLLSLVHLYKGWMTLCTTKISVCSQFDCLLH